MNPADPWMVRMMPATIGSIIRPELTADRPELICRNVGMKAIAENMPSPTAAPRAVATTKVRLPNSDSGMIGSTARRSTATNTHAETTNAASRASAWHELQPSLPPKSVNRISDVVVAERATMPAESSGVVLRLRGRVSVNQPMAKAARPTGTLIQKHHCQPRLAWSVKNPPTSGPATAERPNSAPIGPMYLALTCRDDVGDDRLRQDHQPAAAEALDPAPDHEPGEVRRERGADAGGGEQADGDEEERAAAPQVAELAVDGHDQRRREQVGGGHPR